MPLLPHDAPVGNPDAYDLRTASDYSGYRQSTKFSYDPGIFILPIASVIPKTKVVRVHGGYGTRVVTFAASKKGAPPIIPAATDTDRDYLVGANVNVPLPSPSAGSATYDWAVSGQYTFVTRGAALVDSQYVGGARVPGKDFLPEAIISSGSHEDAAAQLKQQIPHNNYLWPFTVMPPQFANPLLLRENS
jgi:hypothetical protein